MRGRRSNARACVILISAEHIYALVRGFGVLLGSGLVYGLAYGNDPAFKLLAEGRWGLGWGLVYALYTFRPIYKLYAGFVAGLSPGEIAIKVTPNEGIRRSARMAWISRLIWSPGGGLSFGFGVAFGLGGGGDLGLVVGLGAGLDSGLRYGGRACLQHPLLRLVLRHDGVAPWRYVAFLDYGAERIFLRKVGGGYIFIRRLLQEYFAACYTEPDGVAAQEPAEQASSTPS